MGKLKNAGNFFPALYLMTFYAPFLKFNIMKTLNYKFEVPPICDQKALIKVCYRFWEPRKVSNLKKFLNERSSER